ncbi:hypothetical protein L7F22_068684 [Adiantum nelumboides]|nr:hypothetical protein [Adiantum nelumboides]
MDSTCRWWNEETVAVVTGGNKGIGLEVCKQLAERGVTVVLTARDNGRGSDALCTLRKQDLDNVQFHPLDVTDDESIAALASWILQQFGGFDILINNAAVNGVVVDEQYVKDRNISLADMMFKQESAEGFVIEYESAKACLDANYYGAQHVTKALIPLLRSSSQGARIINVGSDYGQLHLGGQGWPIKFPSYKMSKVALHAYTRVLARELEKKSPVPAINARVFVNCVHPGYVRTELTGLTGQLSSQEGATNVVKIALLPPEVSPSGQFFYEGNLASF